MIETVPVNGPVGIQVRNIKTIGIAGGIEKVINVVVQDEVVVVGCI